MNKTQLNQLIKVREEVLKQSQGYGVMANETYVDSFSHFLIWDDKNYILYAITANIEVDTQGGLPYRIKMIDYAFIERVWSLYSDDPKLNTSTKGGTKIDSGAN